MIEPKHSPLPWRVGRHKHEGDCINVEIDCLDGHGGTIFTISGRVGPTRDDYPTPPDALLIVRAVNNFYPMLAALKKVEASWRNWYGDKARSEGHPMDQLIAVIAVAEK